MKIAVLLLLLLDTGIGFCQFTKVTSASNPIINDLKESGGGSWIDINDDDLLDLFVSHGNLSNQNNALYLNSGSGNFIKVSTGSIVNDGGTSIGSTWGDYNADGWLDCYVVNRNNTGNFLYLGFGDTSFTRINSVDPVTQIANSNSASWVDYDNDGDLDLSVINFQGADFLFGNNGPFIYDLSAVPPLDSGNGFSIHGAWSDYNNDFHPDLFIGNAGLQNDVLHVNNGSGPFQPTFFQDGKSTLGASWADFDNDGDMDLFTASFLNEGSILYVNDGPPSYSFTVIDTGLIAQPGQSVGTAFGDADNDGDLDLFVCNDGQDNFFFMNNGPPSYDFAQITSGDFVNDGGHSFGCTFADYDNDGHLDLFVANRMNENDFLYHNNGNSNHWLTVKCTAGNNAIAMGAKVRVNALINGVRTWQLREVQAQSGYNSQNLWLHFGLGNALLADSVIIQWPSGTSDTCLNIQTNRLYNAMENGCPTADIGTGKKGPSFRIYPNPATELLTIEGLDEGRNEINITDINGRSIYSATAGSSCVIETGNLEKGFYLINIRGRDRSERQSFLKL